LKYNYGISSCNYDICGYHYRSDTPTGGCSRFLPIFIAHANRITARKCKLSALPSAATYKSCNYASQLYILFIRTLKISEQLDDILKPYIYIYVNESNGFPPCCRFNTKKHFLKSVPYYEVFSINSYRISITRNVLWFYVAYTSRYVQSNLKPYNVFDVFNWTYYTYEYTSFKR